MEALLTYDTFFTASSKRFIFFSGRLVVVCLWLWLGR